MGFCKEYWGGQPFFPPWDVPSPGIEPMSLMSPTLAGGFFTTSAAWEARDPTRLMAKKSEQKQYHNEFHKDFLRIVHIKKKNSPEAATELQTGYRLKMQTSGWKISSE